MQQYELIVIGGGPAGYLGAERAGAAGLKVAVVEKNALGGVCLNEGCIPSKTLLHSAKVYSYATHGQAYGVTTQGAAIDHAAVLKRKNKVVKKLVAGVGAKLKQHQVTVIPQTAVIEGRKDGLFVVQAGAEQIAAPKLLIAAGSTPVVPGIEGLTAGLESGFVLTSREILDLAELPKHLIIVGGGVIGLEMAGYYSTAGCKVSVIEMMDKIAGPTEREISAALQKQLQANGVEFYLNHKVVSIDNGGVTFEHDGQPSSLKADKVLLSIGRKPSVQGLGLENLGVYTENGAIVTDNHMQTNVAGIYAAGDINGKSMLAHTAYREAEVAVNHILGRADTMRYGAVPSVIYTNPEVACIGETEETAVQKGIPVRVARLPMSYAGRYVAEVERGEGFCKILVDSRYDCIVGAHLIGSYASEMIYGVGLMIERQIPVRELKELVFPHPTVSEILRETIFEL